MRGRYSKLTDELDLALTHAGPFGKGLVKRSKRAAMYLEDGVFKVVNIAEGPTPKGEEDPAGDDYPEATLAPARRPPAPPSAALHAARGAARKSPPHVNLMHKADP